MKEFIAKLGYTMMWAFGIPKYPFEEAFEGYYRVGIVFISLVVICILVFVSVGIGELIEWRKKRIEKEIIFINQELNKIDMDKVYEEQEKWKESL